MKSDSKFKFPRNVRALLSSIGNKDARDAFRNAMVQATLTSMIRPEKERKSK